MVLDFLLSSGRRTARLMNLLTKWHMRGRQIPPSAICKCNSKWTNNKLANLWPLIIRDHLPSGNQLILRSSSAGTSHNNKSSCRWWRQKGSEVGRGGGSDVGTDFDLRRKREKTNYKQSADLIYLPHAEAFTTFKSCALKLKTKNTEASAKQCEKTRKVHLRYSL